ELLPTPSEKMAEAEKKSSSSTQNPKKGKKPPTPTLKRLALPISEQAIEHELERCFGREEECEQLFQLITSAGGKAIVVVGPSGSGKTALLHEVAYRLHHEQTPESIRARRIWFADASRLIVDPGLFSNWQSQCLDLLQECIDNDAILYIGDLLHLLDAGKHVHSEQNVSMLLKPYLTRRKLTVVAECTPRHFSQVELRDPSFSRLFRPYRLEDPALPNIEEIMKQVAQDIRKERAISWKLSGQKTILELSQRFQTTPSLLGHCLQFMHRVTEDVAIHTQKSPSQNSSSSRQTGSSTLSPLAISTKESIIERNQVLNSFCRETGMPQFLVRDDIPMHTEEVQRFFLQRLIGQDHAVQSIGDLVSMIKAGFSDPTRPLGSFLFVGPTGVGKTEMAKTLTHFLFGTPQKLIRFDMSEFASPSSVYRFLGDLQEEGKLIREIRQSPFSVLLLDEIEKAHAVIFDVLLQVLGEARITDEQGRTADFRNVVIVMTSNLGVSTFRERPGFSSSAPSDFHQHFMAEAERFFRPEFFNRIDQIIPFTPLPQQAIKKICDKELAKIRKRQGLQQDKRHLELSTSAVAWITEQGVDPRYGARPLKRVLEQQLVTPLAKHLCAQRSPQRHTIQVEHDSTQLRFQNLSEDRNPKTTEVAQ
ncbi:MAG: AAA family ATPase, partial [Myxococcota bacterium]